MIAHREGCSQTGRLFTTEARRAKRGRMKRGRKGTAEKEVGERKEGNGKGRETQENAESNGRER